MFTTKKVRAAVIAIAAIGAALASGGVASAGKDISPWSTTHGQVAMADGAVAGKVTLQPFVITKKIDRASAVLI